MKINIRCLILFLILCVFCSCTMSVSAIAPIRPYRYGDMDHDFEITTTDARLVLQSCVGKGYKATKSADVDGDGEVTTTDARLILQYCVQKRSYSYVGDYQEWVYPADGEPYLKTPKLRWRW